MVIAKWKQTSKLDLRFEKDGKCSFDLNNSFILVGVIEKLVLR